MANHGFITTKRQLTVEKLKAALDEINKRRFRGLLELPPDGDSGFVITVKDLVERPIWVASRRKIEIRHSCGGGDFAWWIDAVVLNDLALAFDGVISDEGVGDKWRGVENKYPRYLDFKKAMWGWGNSSLARRTIANMYIQSETSGILSRAPEWAGLLD